MKLRGFAGARIAGFAAMALLVAWAGAGLALGQGSVDPLSAPQETATLYASGDATIKSGAYANTNFGGDDPLLVAYSQIDTAVADAVLLRFDLTALPAGAIVDSAYLELDRPQAGLGLNPVGITAYCVTSSWDESTVTWNMPLTVAGPGILAGVDSGTGWQTWGGIGGCVQGWIAGPSNGLLLLGPAATGTPFFQRSFTSRHVLSFSIRPHVVVTYSVPPTATPTQSPLFSGHVYAGQGAPHPGAVSRGRGGALRRQQPGGPGYPCRPGDDRRNGCLLAAGRGERLGVLQHHGV